MQGIRKLGSLRGRCKNSIQELRAVWGEVGAQPHMIGRNEVWEVMLKNSDELQSRSVHLLADQRHFRGLEQLSKALSELNQENSHGFPTSIVRKLEKHGGESLVLQQAHPTK